MSRGLCKQVKWNSEVGVTRGSRRAPFSIRVYPWPPRKQHRRYITLAQAVSGKNFVRPFISPVFKCLTQDTGELTAINPEISSGLPLQGVNRFPPPASRPERYSTPATKGLRLNILHSYILWHLIASDPAQNPYWKRDVRRAYPQLSVITQDQLSQLLIEHFGASTYVPWVFSSAMSSKRTWRITPQCYCTRCAYQWSPHRGSWTHELISGYLHRHQCYSGLLRG